MDSPSRIGQIITLNVTDPTVATQAHGLAKTCPEELLLQNTCW
jgi:hypothetical protein